MEMVRTDLSHYAKFLTFELKPSALIEKNRKEPEPDKSFELELWTWNEFEVPTLQRRSRYRSMDLPKYVYDITTGKLVEAAPATTDLLARTEHRKFVICFYTDDTPYRMQREWL